MRHVLVVSLALALTACASDVPTSTESVIASPRVASIADRASYIVVFRSDVADPRGKALGLAKQFGGSVTFTYTSALKGFAATLPSAAVAALATDPAVDFIELDQEMTAFATQTNLPSWGLDRIDDATGLDGSFAYSRTGKGVTAYIIDTGILTSHTDFGGRATFGFDAGVGGTPGTDCNGHGTHVAGTVGGTTYGVAKAVSLVAVRVLNCQGSGTTSGVIAGVDWVTSNKKLPAVANMSLGGGASQALDLAVQNSINSGVAYAVAAGNGNSAGVAQDACNYSPARVADAMTIGATDKGDNKASWSNYGSCVDWFAPGVSITSAWIGKSNKSQNTISGTSMATPHTTGVAALVLEGTTTTTPADVAAALRAATTKNVVKNAGAYSTPSLLFTNY